MKYNGGIAKADLNAENVDALKKGIVNLEKHIENLQQFGVPIVVTLNQFITDTDAELNYIKDFVENMGCDFALAKVWEQGGEGGLALAEKVVEVLETKQANFKMLYEDDMSLEDKIHTIATKIYGANGVNYVASAKKQLEKITSLGYGNLPVCMAKTQYSLSDDQTKLGRPTDFDITVRDVYVNAGAGFVVAITGSIMTMPGLPKVPAAENIDVVDNQIVGLF